MNLLQAIVLGFVQGVTEFLPISSSAHLILVPWFFNWQDPGMAFDVFLHGGTLLAILGYFAQDWIQLIKGGVASILERKIGFERERLLFWLVVAATIPAAVIGYVFNHHVEEHFRAPLPIAATLAALGFLLYWVDGKYPALRSVDELTMKDAMWIGFAQAAALFPGVSRSGSTMTMGRLRGLSRESAARFSFLLATPITGAAFLFKLKPVIALAQAGQLEWSYLITGFAMSLIFGILSIHVLLHYLRVADFRIFAWYRLLLAAFIIIWSLVTNR